MKINPPLSNPEKPGYGILVKDYPTPNLNDRFYIERYDHTLASFGPRNSFREIPAYGTPHPDYPFFRLAYVNIESPHETYTWYWVNDRTNESAYNYEIDYPEGNVDHPRIRRLYHIRRSEYEPLAFGSEDPMDGDDSGLFDNVKLVEQRMRRTGNEVLDSLYVLVERIYQTLPGPILVAHDTDSETQTPVTISRQRIRKADFVVDLTPGQTTEYQPETDYWGYKIVTTLVDYADISRTEKDYVNFSFPRLITGATTSSVVSRKGDIRTVIAWAGRDGFTQVVPMTTTIYYNTEALLLGSAPGVQYAPILNRLRYDGVFYNVNEGPCLNNSITIGPFSTGTQNPLWGFVVEGAAVFPASSPSASGYMGLVGSPVVVGIVIKPWKYNLYRMEVQRLTLR